MTAYATLLKLSLASFHVVAQSSPAQELLSVIQSHEHHEIYNRGYAIMSQQIASLRLAWAELLSLHQIPLFIPIQHFANAKQNCDGSSLLRNSVRSHKTAKGLEFQTPELTQTVIPKSVTLRPSFNDSVTHLFSKCDNRSWHNNAFGRGSHTDVGLM